MRAGVRDGAVARPAATLAVILVVVSTLAIAAPARATTVLRLPLALIAADAGRIVHGTVVDVREGRDETGLPATWVTLDVARTLKGPAIARTTIKQFGLSGPLPDGTVARVPGLPRYAVGDEVVLFLHPESGRGFTSPVGFGQGAYRVDRRRGRPTVASEAHRHGREGREDLDRFLDDVGRLAGGGR
jgi:hypothetical protein